MAGQYEQLNCPFCDKGRITCLHFPSTKNIKMRSTATFGRTKAYSKSSEEWLIQTGCSACGKTADEVEKELKKKDII